MPLFMTQASYNSDAWAAQISNPQDRAASLSGAIEAAGGKVVSIHDLMKKNPTGKGVYILG